MLLDVLTFYQERIANEGYLRTATERRSVLDLVRLVGYVPSPGVAASVYLAYTLDATSGPVEIPAGARAQSIPGPGELPQSFETSEPLQAHAAWNNLKPRMTQPQKITTNGSALDKDTIYFDGTATNLKANDPLLFVFDGRTTILRHVKTVEVQFDEKRTRVRLQEAPFSSGSGGTGDSSGSNGEGSGAGLAPLLRLVKPLSLPPSLQPANGLRLNRSSHQAFEAPGDTLPQLLTVFQPRIAETAYRAWANAAVTPPVTVEVYVLRVTASLFGHNAPRKIDSVVRGRVSTSEWLIIEGEEGNRVEHEEMNVVYLDASYDKILPDSWIVVDTSLVEGTDSTP